MALTAMNPPMLKLLFLFPFVFSDVGPTKYGHGPKKYGHTTKHTTTEPRATTTATTDEGDDCRGGKRVRRNVKSLGRGERQRLVTAMELSLIHI